MPSFGTDRSDGPDAARVWQLEQELVTTRALLHTSMERMEGANAALRAS
jgi:hypothetical protein